ncbi:A/G-specific adenine glycosylase [Halalkalibacter sp. AB-rgal2]|uniref:A/G-specific adenine glycosylase n=1 Tax=Halalkalibacter sp. AB-rgal2 TaxID=3242695 RepID=UPI00359DBF83
MSQPYVKDFSQKTFQVALVEWFHSQKRDLPWRQTSDPYKIWVSEIMLQQTRVDTVIPYYQAFIRQFPTLFDLAKADEDAILKAWEGLGYYSRVRNLQKATQQVLDQFNGVVPDTRKEISSLKGVGPYTAGAILSIAYGKPEPAVDGNVMRVLARVLLVNNDIAKPATRKLFETILYELIHKDDPSGFNQGLMELGALICTPTSPGCLICPVQQVCRAYSAGKQDELPVKTKKKKPKAKELAATIIRNDKGEVLIEKRPDNGLLARLWQFPMVEAKRDEQVTAIHEQFATYDISLKLEDKVQEVEHAFSHLKWTIDVYEGTAGDQSGAYTVERMWVEIERLEDYAFPVSHQKIIEALKKRQQYS